MFTGIVAGIGRVAGVETRGADRRLRIASEALPWRQLQVGESIAVNGVCLTAVAFGHNEFVADVSAETLAVSTLVSLASGGRVNLEAALALGERLGGHLVSGHVDGIGTVRSRRAEGRAVRLEVELPAGLARYVARKGSVCIDGVSLTVNEVSGNRFGVAIIPHTLEVTICADYREGTAVNIEVDMMARYLERLLARDDGDGLSRDFLKAHGYG